MAIIKNPITVISGGGGDLVDLVDRTITSFTMPSGKTTIGDYLFYQTTSLLSADLTGCTEIGGYVFSGCSNLSNVIFDNNITTIGVNGFAGCGNLNTTLPKSFTELGNSAFSRSSTTASGHDLILETLNPCTLNNTVFSNNADLKEVKGIFKNIGGSVFNGCINLETVDIVFDDSSSSVYALGSQVFYNCGALKKLKISGKLQLAGTNAFAYAGGDYINEVDFSNANITTINATGVFQYFTYSRVPTNQIKIDLRNSTFASLPNGTFSFNENVDIMLPETLTSMGSTEWGNCTDCNIYFKGNQVVPNPNTNIFSFATNCKVFVPYNLVHSYKIATNWSASSSYIYGWASENTFTLGQTLPQYNDEGYALTWYSDIGMTTQVSTVSDANAIYYCTIGATQVMAKIIYDLVEDTNVVITDGTNTYSNGDFVALGTTLTITANPTNAGDILYNLRIDNVDFTSGNTMTISSHIHILAISGISITTTFENTSWANIKKLAQAGIISSKFAVGDTKSITDTDNNTWTVRIVDMQAGRYKYSDKLVPTNAVFEFMETALNASSMFVSTTQFYPTSIVNKTTLPALLNTFTDIKDLLENVDISVPLNTPYTSMGICSTKLFLPAYYERKYAGTNTYYVKETISPFNNNTYNNFTYYDNTGDSDAKFTKTVITYQSNYQTYWLRTPYYYSSNQIRYYGISSYSSSTALSSCCTFGSAGTSNSQRYISPCFAF